MPAFGDNLIFSGSAAKEFGFGYAVDVSVRDASGDPVPGAMVESLDNGVVKNSRTTVADGRVLVRVASRACVFTLQSGTSAGGGYTAVTSSGGGSSGSATTPLRRAIAHFTWVVFGFRLATRPLLT